MAKKPRERYKDRNPAGPDPAARANANPKPTATLEALRRRRYKRFLFVGLIGLMFPILELIAYQYRAITLSFANRSDQLIRAVKVTYDGGAFEIPELKPGGVVTRVIRPDYSFKSDHFSTYLLTIRFGTEDGGFISQIGRIGAIDFSAKELYTIESIPPNNQIQLKHMTRPGFPLGLVRDLMERLGIG